MAEIWKDVVGYEGLYQVSSRGRVKRVAGGQGAIAGRILKPATHRTGYQHMVLSSDGKAVDCYVHRLVCEAFHGPPPTLEHQTNHKNGIKADNRAGNLEWVTHSENAIHTCRALGQRRGEKHHMAKLSADDVRWIREAYATGEYSHGELGRMFGVARETIGRIVRRETWIHM